MNTAVRKTEQLVGYRVVGRDSAGVAAGGLVGAHDGLTVPVAPVDPVLEDAHRERVTHHAAVGQHVPPIAEKKTFFFNRWDCSQII